MAAGVGQKIDAVDYTSIQNKIATVLGTGSSNYGYGQTVTSPSNIVSGNKIQLTHWLTLRTDLAKARAHQTGTAIGTSSATDGVNLLVPSSSLVITEALRNQYSLFADTVTTNRFASNEFSPETLAAFTKQNTWNGTIQNVVTITGSATGLGSAENMRFFFNAGGTINITASLTGYSGTGTDKGPTWYLMLNQAGTVTMNYTTTTYTGSGGTTYNIGYYSLTTSDQLIFYKPAPAGVYAENDYWIYARKSSNGADVIMTIRFQDDDAGDQQGGFLPGASVDEQVTGNLTTTVTMNRPSGANVSVVAPTASQTGM